MLQPDAAGKPRRYRLRRRWPRATPRSPPARPTAWSRRARCRAGSRSRRPWPRCTRTAVRPRRGRAARRRAASRARTPRRRPHPRRRPRRPPTRPRATPRSTSVPTETSRYQRSHASRLWVMSRSPMPVTRTSLPGGAVVAVKKRCFAKRSAGAPRSWALRSTPGRHVEVSTVGNAKSASTASAG